MSHTVSERRPVCDACLRPLRGCCCHWIRPVSNDVEVLVLQHPLEVRHAKGSARLLHLSLARSRLVVGEVFDDGELRAWLAGPPGATQLLYPETGALPAPTAICPPGSDAPELRRLVVLDGTWRKSLRMLALNPALQELPRVALEAGSTASAYGRIRRARRPDQWSTLEAVCVALTQRETAAPANRYAPLLLSFAGFVIERIAWGPQELPRAGAQGWCRDGR